MQASHIFVISILGAALFTLTVANNANGPNECCFTFYKWRVKRDLTRSYYLTDERCLKPAVILKTMQERMICVNPSEIWVQNLMKAVDKRNF